MSISFDALPWHDAELLELSLDRRSAGRRDEVRIHVVWPDGGEATILFQDCYGMTADMNFGIIAAEQIFDASVLDDEPGLASLREKWTPLGVSLKDLRCYRIETSSTASIIRIYASSFEVI